jgi:hypothetical protein
MTITVATPEAVSRATSNAPRDRSLLLMLPSLAMLIFLFLVPLALFFVRTFTEFDGTTAEFFEQARDLLLSQAYLSTRHHQLDLVDRYGDGTVSALVAAQATKPCGSGRANSERPRPGKRAEPVCSRLAAGGNWIRTFGSARDSGRTVDLATTRSSVGPLARPR